MTNRSMEIVINNILSNIMIWNILVFYWTNITVVKSQYDDCLKINFSDDLLKYLITQTLLDDWGSLTCCWSLIKGLLIILYLFDRISLEIENFIGKRNSLGLLLKHQSFWGLLTAFIFLVHFLSAITTRRTIHILILT